MTGHLLQVVKGQSEYDCSNGGISSRAKNVVAVRLIKKLRNQDTVIERDFVTAQAPFKPNDESPAVVLMADYPAGSLRVRAVPLDAYESGKWTMFGGAYLASSDSRVSDAFQWLGAMRGIAIPFHDRIE